MRFRRYILCCFAILSLLLAIFVAFWKLFYQHSHSLLLIDLPTSPFSPSPPPPSSPLTDAALTWPTFRLLSPDLLFFGTAKSGTTSIFAMLLNHTALSDGGQKEINFLTSRNKFSAAEAQHYDERFVRARRTNRTTIDGTILAINCAHAAEYVARVFPLHTRVFGAFRDPVERAVSNYEMCRRHGNARESFERSALRGMRLVEDCETRLGVAPHSSALGELPSFESATRFIDCVLPAARACDWHRAAAPGCTYFVAMGLYPVLVQPWRMLFGGPRSRLLLFTFERFQAAPLEVIERIWRFAALRSSGLSPSTLPTATRNMAPRSAPHNATSDQLLTQLRRFYTERGVYDWLRSVELVWQSSARDEGVEEVNSKRGAL